MAQLLEPAKYLANFIADYFIILVNQTNLLLCRKMDRKLVLISVVVVVLGLGDVVRAGCDTENLNPAVAKDDKNYA